MGLFDIKPKDKNDYYTIFIWMVSKKLAYLVILSLGVVSAAYIWSHYSSLITWGKTDGVRAYNYDSVRLRFASGKVQILGKSGYLAYEGEVSKGRCEGEGSLYNPAGDLVYSGHFEDSQYNGEGKLYYSDGAVRYEGGFANNLFEGTGKLYRENASLLYEGEFTRGLRNGEGRLYDNGEDLIYTGMFRADELLYSDMLGLDMDQLAEQYTGKRDVYQSENAYHIHMSDIGALCTGSSDITNLDDKVAVKRIYVLSGAFPTMDGTLKTVSELKNYFGQEVYSGNSVLEEGEALAIDLVRLKSGSNYYSEDSGIEFAQVYDDYYTIDGYTDSKLVYLYSYELSGLEYTFVCEKQNGNFGFYYIEQGDSSEDALSILSGD